MKTFQSESLDSSQSCEVAAYQRLPVEIVQGKGARLTDNNGNHWTDFHGGHAAALLGQAHPALIDELARQGQELFFQTNLVEISQRTKACRMLVDFAP